MSDLALRYDSARGGMDLFLEDDDLALDQGLETSVLLSLFLDRRAADEDVLVEPENRRGWWGDQFAELDGDEQGSRLWQLDRALLTADVEGQVEVAVNDSLDWMVEDVVVGDVETDVETDDRRRALAWTTTITRPDGATINFRFADLWSFDAVQS